MSKQSITSPYTPVLQFSLDGKFIKKWDDVRSICGEYKVTKPSIHYAVKNKSIFRGTRLQFGEKKKNLASKTCIICGNTFLKSQKCKSKREWAKMKYCSRECLYKKD